MFAVVFQVNLLSQTSVVGLTQEVVLKESVIIRPQNSSQAKNSIPTTTKSQIQTAN